MLCCAACCAACCAVLCCLPVLCCALLRARMRALYSYCTSCCVPPPCSAHELQLFLGDCPAVGPSERRVLVHASVWEKFMSKFKMYRPLLSRIKSEYEMVLHQYSQQLHVLNATQFKVAAENLVKSEEHLEMKNKHLDEIACLRSKLDSLTKDKKSEGDSIEKITEMVDHWKLQASTRVPIIKLQMCEAECVELSASLAAETTAHNNTKADLQSAYAELNRRNEDAERALKQLSGMTPRPDWMEISTSVPELAEAFRKSENSADRLEKMESLLKKSTAAMKKAQKKKATGRKKAKPGAFDYFTGMGMAKDIPEYLRTNGRVRNNHLTKGACEDLVKECWAEKQRYDDAQGKKSKLSAFFPLFLAEKCGQDQVIEQAYNMWFALRDYSYDADCDLFCRIVQGKMDEEVYTDQMSMLDALKQQFKDHDKLLNGESTGKLPKEALKAVFGDFFPVKSDKEVKDCFKQLDKEHPGAVVGYEGIFEEDAEGNQGDFIEGVRDQHLSDREEYIESIEDALWDQDTQDSGEISYSQLLEAFKSFDPDKPTEEVADIAVRSLGCPAKSLKPNKVLAIPAFLKTVQGMSVHRRTKKPS
eukprot:TRINITY_DN2898_c0_g1_i1.p1 TRINITY_DN2898_c0_g1~~TRINITY_DN2898_c0_g1_i1.p1  ORF type:complete len:589 (+),score=225.02 TRINITY_DN2898_c0_g1_i1:517-2283(+)